MFRVRTVFTGVAGLPGYSNLYFQGSTLQYDPDLVTAVHDFWDSLLEFSDDACIARVEGDVVSIDEATGEIVAIIPGTDQLTGGQNTGALLPTVVQGLVRFGTGQFVAGRELAGHAYIPCIAQAAGTTAPSPTTQTAWQNAITQLVTDSGTLGLEWVVWSKTHLTTREVITGAASGQYSVLRSRRD